MDGAAITSTGLCKVLPNMNEVKFGGVLRIAFCLPASCETGRANGCTIIGRPVAAVVTSIGVDVEGPRSP